MFHFYYVCLVTAKCTIILTPLVDAHLHQNKDKIHSALSKFCTGITYLTDTIGTEIYIGRSDRICTSCYNTHSCIIKSMQCQLSGTDEMLEKKLKHGWRQDENTPTNSILIQWFLLPSFYFHKRLFCFHGYVKYFSKPTESKMKM